MLQADHETLQKCDDQRLEVSRDVRGHGFRSYRTRLRRRLTPILIVAIGGIAVIVGRGSRIIAGKVLGEETCSYLLSTVTTIERLGPEPDAVRSFLRCLIRHPEREVFLVTEDGNPLLLVGHTDDTARLIQDGNRVLRGRDGPEARIFGIGPFDVRLVGVIPFGGSRVLIMERRLNGLWTPFTTGVVAFVFLVILGTAGTVTYLSNRIYRPVVDRLRTLEDGLVRYGGGESSVRLEPCVGIRDEFDEVFEAFNRMAGRINELEDERTRRMDEERTLLANLAHDINTPITVLRGYAETLVERGPDLPTQTLASIHTELLGQALYVQAIVEDLLTLARERSAQLRIDPVDVDLDELFDNVVDTFQPLALQREISVFGDAEGLRSHADPVRLRQILTNLVRNALLHARGASTVELGARQLNGGTLVWVEDDGCGIPEELASGLFERYCRGKDSSAPGWGLGLYIVRTLAELHGGWVRYVHRDPGSRFEIWLPGRGDDKPGEVHHGEGAAG